MSLKVWLPLISNTNSIGLIREGITPHNISTYNASKFGTAAQLNGSNGYIEGSVYTTATMTYMCWVYFDTLKGCHLLDCRTSAGNGYQPMYINPSSGVQVGGSTSAFQYIPYTFAAATWYHIAVTYSATKCQLFVNGALVGESTSGKGTAINAERPFYLGCRCTQINWTHGRINDFRIYDHTCSAKEIAEVARGLFLHYKFDSFGETTIADCSGYRNNGSIIGEVEISNVTKRYSHSMYINSPNATDGTATGAYYIDAPCNLGTPKTISVTWWCDPIAGYSSATANGIWCTTANGTGSDYTTSAFNHRDLAFNVNSADGTQHLRPSTSSMTTGEWHHYALVYNGRTVTFYKDGVSQTSASFTADTALGNMSKLLIGISRAGSVNRKVKAYYSDFRVYVTALTAQQVEDLYNEQVAIGRTAAIFARELVEDSSIAVTHNGQLTANSFQETGTTAFFKKNGTVKGSDIYEY